jgi:KUP system potassium uptake protein
MTAQPTGTAGSSAHNLRYNKVLHQHVIVLTVSTVPVPYVAPEERVSVTRLGNGLFNARVQYGFMEDPDIPDGPHVPPRRRRPRSILTM